MIKASFSILPSLLVVNFTDTSTTDEGCKIESWSWNFGDPLDPVPDPNLNVSIEQNPTHTFSKAGKFKVTLTVTDDAGETATTFRYILVSTDIILPVSIEDLVKLKLPSGFPYQPEQISTSIAIWQLYIQPLINSPYVQFADVYNELAYPPIINALIGYLVAYEIMLDYTQNSAMTAAGSGIDGAAGVVKRIETGPSNAEFRDTSDYLKYLTAPGGIMEQIKKQVCMLASRSRIAIAYCPPIPKPIFIPKKAGRPYPHYNMWATDFTDIILVY